MNEENFRKSDIVMGQIQKDVEWIKKEMGEIKESVKTACQDHDTVIINTGKIRVMQEEFAKHIANHWKVITIILGIATILGNGLTILIKFLAKKTAV